MNRRAIRAGRADVEIGIRDRLDQGIAGARRKLDGFASSTARLGGVLAAATLASGAVFGKLGKDFAAIGDEVDKMAARTGVAVGVLSGLGFAAEQSGASLQSIERSMFGLSRSFFDLSRGGGEAVDAYGRLGITFRDLEGLSPEQQLFRVADGLAAVEDTSLRGALAQRIFGRSGRELLPLLAAGSEGMRELIAEADTLGRVLSEDDTKAAAELTDAMNRVNSVIRSVFINIGGALAPALTDVANTIAGASASFVQFVRSNGDVIRAAAAATAGIGLLGGGLLAVSATSKLVGVGLGLVSGAAGAVSTATSIATGVIALFEATTFSLSGAMLLASGSAGGLVGGLSLLTAAEAANAGVAGVLTGIYGLLSGAVGIFTGSVSIATVALTAFSAVASAIGSVVAVAFAPVTLAILAVGAGITALIGLVAVAAVRAFDFGAAFDSVRGIMSGVVSTFSQVFSTIKDAIASGDTETLMRALWASVRLIWFRGIEGTLSIGRDLFDGFLSYIGRFFSELVGIASDSISFLVEIFINPFEAFSRLQNRIGNFVSSISGFDISSNVADAEAELRAIRESLNVDKQRTVEANKRRETIDGIGEESPTESQGAGAFESKLAAINQQILAITRGEEAAEQFALRNQDVTEEQIAKIQEQQRELQRLKDLYDETQRQQDLRVEAIFGRADQLSEGGLGPADVFQRVITQINADLAAGRIDQDDARGARERAVTRRGEAVDQLNKEGQALADALRTAE
ncbi:MAG: phage tail tape measure protein [Planctomycetota bacterium]